ncbi:C2H2 domain-containing protein [Lophiotrema nucula]|uniref:C2H2 domain-containing protein n=1 Tax=Lophiotrema nucula TaxID=690887 RepID=A0A6A5Z655_9PLEO|nr:C2H2 domain-containing protein [Lophiotrema nucula]
MSRATTLQSEYHPSQAFMAAYTKFRARLTGDQLQKFQDTTFDNLCHEIGRIQVEQENHKRMMNLSRIQSCLEALDQFGKVIEIFLNVSDAVAFVWGPIKFLLITATNFTESFDTLLSAYEQIGETLPLLKEYESLFGSSAAMLNALELIYIDILEFHRHALRFFKGKTWTRFFRSDMVQFHRYQQDIAEIKTNLEVKVGEERQKKVTAIKEWLGVGAQSTEDHAYFLSVRKGYPTTGRWILKHELVQNWMNADIADPPILWMTGIPGAEMIKKTKEGEPRLTSYYYCKYNAGNSAVAVIRGLLDQLIDQHSDLVPHCHTRYANSGEPSLRSLSLARKLLEDFCLTVPNLSIVVDGLDECEPVERRQVLDLFLDLVALSDEEEPGRLRILIISQDYPDIRKLLYRESSKVTVKTIPLRSSDNEKDIRVYVNDLANQIKVKYDLNDDQTGYLKDLTLSRAQGMFLYAKLVMPILLEQPTRQDLLLEIQFERFPDDLGAAKLLGWMVCAKRQLTWKEIQVALSLNLEAQEIEYDDRRLRSHVHDICGSLVLLNGNRVQLVHSTAKICTQEIHEPTVECELASLCLQYLTFSCFEKDEEIDKKELRRMAVHGHFAFQDYAIAKWSHHVSAFVNSGRHLINSPETSQQLEEISIALEDFLRRYEEEDWYQGIVPECRKQCQVFEQYGFYEDLVALTSHIYTFQKKGFEARHLVSIKGLSTALDRNRKILEELPKKASKDDMATFEQFYDTERRFKCSKITCMYFSEGFKDHKSRKKHVNVHDRPYQCEAIDCLGSECGFANSKDLEKHIRSFHPEMSDLAKTFNSTNAQKAKANFLCSICGKSFTRRFHKDDHEKSHRGERPHACPECGRAFTRLNDMKRHQKLHDRPDKRF